MRHTIAALALLAAAVPSFAQTAFEPGVYVALNGGRASLSSKYADDSSDITLGAATGYQFTRNLGFEVYTRSLSFTPFRGTFQEPGYYPDNHYGIAAMGTLPLNERFNLFGRAGIGRTSMKGNRSSLQDKDETDPVVGVGVSYAFNRQWSLNLEGSYLTKSEVSLLSFGARFQF
jgi:opacity protein-like surface antigen